jgi:hypothetical protein
MIVCWSCSFFLFKSDLLSWKCDSWLALESRSRREQAGEVIQELGACSLCEERCLTEVEVMESLSC